MFLKMIFLAGIFEDDFFGREAGLTVSGQLEAELFACALGNVYTFGPTFRAENSNTPRHAAEFWMIEPEMAFADLNDNMDLGENLVKSMAIHVMENCKEDLELFTRFVDKNLIHILETVIENTYSRIRQNMKDIYAKTILKSPLLSMTTQRR